MSFFHMLYRWKPGEDVRHHQPRPTKYYFGEWWQIRSLLGSMSENSKRRLELVVGLCEVCASAACCQAGAVFFANNMVVFPHSSYMPDLVPFDFSMFLRIKMQLWGCCFQDIPESQEQFLTFTYVIPWSHCKEHFQKWQKYWPCCINVEGAYFERDNNYQ
jgi:hypothetical protein